MFEAVLRDVVESTEGAVASLVMDLDGIPLDSYSRPDAPFDIKAVGVEFGVVIKSIAQAAQMLSAGNAQEVTIVADSLVTLIRLLSPRYFIALTLRPGGNAGRGRYLLRTRAPELLEELS
ncbi:MAG: hypothetical protein HY744_33770 [Deltaproteobacteria bacterium]|nr:hypothetical protein [Deltaproteobacteria bacterium]